MITLSLRPPLLARDIFGREVHRRIGESAEIAKQVL